MEYYFYEKYEIIFVRQSADSFWLDRVRIYICRCRDIETIAKRHCQTTDIYMWRQTTANAISNAVSFSIRRLYKKKKRNTQFYIQIHLRIPASLSSADKTDDAVADTETLLFVVLRNAMLSEEAHMPRQPALEHIKYNLLLLLMCTTNTCIKSTDFCSKIWCEHKRHLFLLASNGVFWICCVPPYTIVVEYIVAGYLFRLSSCSHSCAMLSAGFVCMCVCCVCKSGAI